MGSQRVRHDLAMQQQHRNTIIGETLTTYLFVFVDWSQEREREFEKYDWYIVGSFNIYWLLDQKDKYFPLYWVTKKTVITFPHKTFNILF